MAELQKRKVIATNRRARFEYFIEDTFEAGIVLVGSEVKSLRLGKTVIDDCFGEIKNGEAFLINGYISEYKGANRFNHEPRRPRKLLLKSKELRKLTGKLKTKGYTLVVLSFYFNQQNRAKLELGLGKGKQLHDKRATIKERDWQRATAWGREDLDGPG